MYILTILNNENLYNIICWYLFTKYHDKIKNIVLHNNGIHTNNIYQFEKGNIIIEYKKEKISISGIVTDKIFETSTKYGFIKKLVIECKNKDTLEYFFEHIKLEKQKTFNEKVDKISVYVHEHGDWNMYRTYPKRNIDSVVIDNHIKNNIITNINNFYNDVVDYKKYGMPHKNVILLHGPPGTGKTSLLFALASYFNKNICILNFGSNITDEDFIHLMADIPENSFLFFEDVDALFKNREAVTKGTKGYLSFSTILNFLDGNLRIDGLITFLTTNHLDKLDPALTRTGRINLLEKLDYPNKEQIADFYKLYYPKCKKEDLQKFVNICSKIKKLSPSTINTFLFNHRKDKNIFDFIKEINH